MRVAASTQRHVHVRATNHGLAGLAGRAEGETGVRSALLADRGQLLDLLALGDQGQDGGERATHEGPLQRRNDDNLAVVGRCLRETHDVLKELAFVDRDHVTGEPFLGLELAQVLYRLSWLLQP